MPPADSPILAACWQARLYLLLPLLFSGGICQDSRQEQGGALVNRKSPLGQLRFIQKLMELVDEGEEKVPPSKAKGRSQ